MKVDLYTKAVLTVIAACLVYFVVKDAPIMSVAHAQSRGPVDVNIVQVIGKPISYLDVGLTGALPVIVTK